MLNISFSPEGYVPAAGMNIANSYSLSISYLMEYVGFAGLIIRLAAACFAIFAIALILRKNAFFSSKVKNVIAWALLLEGIYFFSFIPAIAYLLSVSALPLTSNLCLATALATQIALISPLLILLSRRLKKSSSINPPTTLLTRLSGLTCFGYVMALWITYLLKWVEMSALEGLNWLLTWPIEIAFINTLITFSLAMTFAAIGTIKMLKTNNNPMPLQWWGISAILLSIHLIIFIAYCFSFNSAWLAQFGELWIIPLLPAGIYLLIGKPR